MVSWRAGAAAAAAMTVAGVVGAHSAAAADPTPVSATGVPDACLHGLVICISQDDDTLRLFDHGVTRIEMAVRFGAQRTPTRLGTFKVEWKDENHVSKMFQSAMPYSMFFDGGQAVHYSSDFAARGYRGASHGCVNTRDADATRQLFQTVHIGTKVVVYTNDPAKQARVEKAAAEAKEQDLKDQQALAEGRKPQDPQDRVTKQDRRDDRDQDSWDDDDDPDGPDGF